MKKTKHKLLPEHLLNQLAYQYQCYPLQINLKKVVKDLFSESPPQELATAIDQFLYSRFNRGLCMAAGQPCQCFALK